LQGTLALGHFKPFAKLKVMFEKQNLSKLRSSCPASPDHDASNAAKEQLELSASRPLASLHASAADVF
jgi:hypothetical protein